jgi:uncharacterized membrane protein
LTKRGRAAKDIFFITSFVSRLAAAGARILFQKRCYRVPRGGALFEAHFKGGWKMGKSAFGLSERLAGALSYVLGFVTGIIFLVAEKESKSVRFNALQSTVWSIVVSVVYLVLTLLSGIPLIGFFVGIIFFVFRIFVMASVVYLFYMAYKGVTFKIPYIGEAVWNQVYNK